ncbi:Uma2 family endonuclease [Spirosoma aerolatum]|uniref:Uma2 family endonuclease n=1 Tax=Spirosoma aerolatum TaxID=1211326 RepID=UPI0009AC7591|nr:Uma2 family endonuclease [Spirosoma aerolatum]
MAIAYDTPHRPLPKPRRKIPENLIYEIMDGKPIYRKGYRDVLSGKKTREEIRGASTLQSVIVSYLVILIGKFIDDDAYFVLTGEPGVHLDHRNNLANDIAIYDQTVLTPDKISKKYATVPPQIAIEVDIEADTAEMTENGYIYKKTRKLFEFGVQKIIWVLTDPQVVLIATPDRTETVNWDRDIEIMDGHVFNIAAYLIKKGIQID